jgi:drug/metabolite transporter (DMT)-like permease
MSFPYIGELAGIGTAVLWSMTAVIFTTASHKIGSFTMSHYRMLFGVVLISIMHLLLNGTPLPLGISARDWLFLGASGFFGFFLCDTCLFQSYVEIGPRLGALLFNVYPIISAALAWVILGEVLSVTACLGILVTISGVVWVVLEKGDESPHHDLKKLRRGILLGLGASSFQAMSLLFAKPAMEGAGGVDAVSATLIRALVGGSAYWVVSIVRGRVGVVLKRGRENVGMLGIILLGALVGPAVGVWLSMISIKHAPIGIASTLMALMPVTILPMTAIIHKERITYRAALGAVVACLGAAILFNSR